MVRVSGADVRASLVVLLVAIPFCAGIGAASGAGLQAGFVTALVGGLVVGPLGGARLQVSGPAVSLAALVLPGVGAAVFLAGLLQMAAGLAGAGALSRRVPVSVVAGAVCAAGLAQALYQLTTVTGHVASPHAAVNFVRLPHALAGARRDFWLPGVLTLAVALYWHRVPHRWAPAIPGPLAGVILATLACLVIPNAAPHLHIGALVPALGGTGLIAALRNTDVVVGGCLIALIASAESLVSAEATAWAANAPITLKPSRELVAQGAGNLLCGMLGGLPLAGAIPRSAANMRAGAQGAGANVLHAVWLLALLGLAPWLLRYVPTTSLAALLVLGGWRLVWERTALTASVTGVTKVVPFVATLCAALSVNLATGIAAGCTTSLVLAGIGAASTRALKLARGNAAIARTSSVEGFVKVGGAVT